MTWFAAEQRNIVAVVRLAHEHELWDAAWELTHVAAPFFEMVAGWDDWAAAEELAMMRRTAARTAGPKRSPASTPIAEQVQDQALAAELELDIATMSPSP